MTPTIWLSRQLQRLGALLALSAPAVEGRAWQADDHAARSRALSEEGERLFAALTADSPLPIAIFSRAFGLVPFEVDLLCLAALPELDERAGDAFATLRGHASARRPTLGLAVRLLVGSDVDRFRLWEWLYQRDLWATGLLAPVEGNPPLADRELCASQALVAGLFGRFAPNIGGATARLLPPEPDLLALRPSLAELARSVAADGRARGGGLAVFAASDRAMALDAACAIATGQGRPLLVVGPIRSAAGLREAVASAWVCGATLAVEIAADLPSFVVPDGLALPTTVVLIRAPGTAITAPILPPLAELGLPLARPAEQSAVWRALLDRVGGTAETELLGNQTRLALGTIRAAVDLAARTAGTVQHDDVVAALARVAPPLSSPLAEISRPLVRWDSVVLGARPSVALAELRSRIAHRVTVQDRWGLRGDAGRGDGVVALLHGESGTGKTMVAEALASALGLSMMRIDLSRVVSKYIGETEKNLAAAFDVAEGFRAVLFFDEADALFGRRTAVKDAHDRYANLETNYLLQRLEAFEGVALLATNTLQNMDDAFLRRIPFVIAFPRPNRDQQERIWERHLPKAARGPDVNIAAVAAQVDLVGGEIRSAAVTAAYAAAAEGGLIDQSRLLVSARAELMKRGRPMPEAR